MLNHSHRQRTHGEGNCVSRFLAEHIWHRPNLSAWPNPDRLPPLHSAALEQGEHLPESGTCRFAALFWEAASCTAGAHSHLGAFSFLFPFSCSGRLRRQQGGLLALVSGVLRKRIQLFSWLAGRGEGKAAWHRPLPFVKDPFIVPCFSTETIQVLSVADEVPPLQGQLFTWAPSLCSKPHYSQSAPSLNLLPLVGWLLCFGTISAWSAWTPLEVWGCSFLDASPQLIQRRILGQYFRIKALSYQVESKQCGLVTHT